MCGVWIIPNIVFRMITEPLSALFQTLLYATRQCFPAASAIRLLVCSRQIYSTTRFFLFIFKDWPYCTLWDIKWLYFSDRLLRLKMGGALAGIMCVTTFQVLIRMIKVYVVPSEKMKKVGYLHRLQAVCSVSWVLLCCDVCTSQLHFQVEETTSTFHSCIWPWIKNFT